MQEDDFGLLVKIELVNARKKFPPMNSWHEGYAIIQEELDEFWSALKTKGTSTEDMINELIQVAAMCQRTAEDVMEKDNPLEQNEPSKSDIQLDNEIEAKQREPGLHEHYHPKEQTEIEYRTKLTEEQARADELKQKVESEARMKRDPDGQY